ncbi:hypothetical protein [Mycobacteroides chelonae]|uniref:hypothetical protein n=1 Tax=Mycobacteroides chelonae TaxID=1774 RepID=UPI0009930658|nr:hypothetical protein [Mycobacteroides chelonae]
MTYFFHTTDAAATILRDGFRDSTGSYLFENLALTGVWIGDRPMTVNEGAKGDQVLHIKLPDHLDLRDYEVIEEDKPYREWCVPAALLNEYAEVTLPPANDLG